MAFAPYLTGRRSSARSGRTTGYGVSRARIAEPVKLIVAQASSAYPLPFRPWVGLLWRQVCRHQTPLLLFVVWPLRGALPAGHRLSVEEKDFALPLMKSLLRPYRHDSAPSSSSTLCFCCKANLLANFLPLLTRNRNNVNSLASLNSSIVLHFPLTLHLLSLSSSPPRRPALSLLLLSSRLEWLPCPSPTATSPPQTGC